MDLLKKIVEQYECDICKKRGNKLLMFTLADGRICDECFNKLGSGKYTTKYTLAEAKNKIQSQTSTVATYNTELKEVLKNARTLKTDLLEADFPTPTDEKTAMYRGRIYNISGKDKRFPKLPNDICDTEITLNPFVYGASEPLYCKPGKEIEFSNRPFKDTRTAKEKKEYDEILQRQRETEKNRADYDWILKNLPEIAPKSLSGYVRMKNSNSTNYKKIVEIAKQKGYTIL